MYRIQLGQPATVKVAANLVRLISYNNKVRIFLFLNDFSYLNELKENNNNAPFVFFLIEVSLSF